MPSPLDTDVKTSTAPTEKTRKRNRLRTEPIDFRSSSSASSSAVFGRMARRFVLPGMAKSLAVSTLGVGGATGFIDTEPARVMMAAPSLLLRECPLGDAMLCAVEEAEAAVRGEDMPTLLKDGNSLIDGILDGCSGGSALERAWPHTWASEPT